MIHRLIGRWRCSATSLRPHMDIPQRAQVTAVCIQQPDSCAPHVEQKGITMSRVQRHPLLRKIASRRQRLPRTSEPRHLFELIEIPINRERPRYPPLLGERILTARETEVLCYVARGETDKEIAGKLFLSRRTVSNHVSNILSKLAVTNRREAVKTAFRLGLI